MEYMAEWKLQNNQNRPQLNMRLDKMTPRRDSNAKNNQKSTCNQEQLDRKQYGGCPGVVSKESQESNLLTWKQSPGGAGPPSRLIGLSRLKSNMALFTYMDNYTQTDVFKPLFLLVWVILCLHVIKPELGSNYSYIYSSKPLEKIYFEEETFSLLL